MDDAHRLQALDRANAVRFEVARLCQQIHRAGRRGGAQLAARIVLEGSSPIKVGRLVAAVPRLGGRHGTRMLREADIDGTSRVREVSQGRRQWLAGALLAYAERAHEDPA